jgi:predicted O-methyltransferase YrrM
MINIIDPQADAYAHYFTSALDDVRNELLQETLTTHPHAEMISGHLQGRLLEMLSRMIKPFKILEIGTFTGFSALCLSKGLADGGELHTIELRQQDADTASGWFKKAGNDNIKLHVGDAKQIIPMMNETWDLVFIDADKVSYIEYYELTLPAIKPGGWIIADNVLFHGEVLTEEIKGKNAKAIHAFNTHVAADNRVEQVMLTIRDGLFLIRKL